MKSISTLATILTVALCSMAPPLPAAEPAEEQQLINVLRSNSTLDQKDAACARLKRIGTAASVPALAALLADEQLSHSARYALESMPAPEAGRALLAALDQTAGLSKVGVIHSLGFRRETTAAPALTRLLNDGNVEIAKAAAVSLGKIGTPAAAKALQAALPKATGALRAAVVEGLLTGADRLLQDGNRAVAGTIFRALYDGKEADPVRTAAYCGMIRAEDRRALALVLAGIQSNDGPTQIAALLMAGKIADPGANAALGALLPKLPPVVQIAVIEALQQRNAVPAAQAIYALRGSEDAAVRAAVFTALGALGDEQAAAALLQGATSQDAAEQKAARQALLQLRGNTGETLIALLPTAPPAQQAEIIRALAGRGEKTTASKLLDLARTGNETTQTAALRAVASLADAPQVTALVGVIEAAKTESARTLAQEALATACRKGQGKPGFNLEPIVAGLKRGTIESQMALIQVASELKDSRVREALRAAVKAADARLRATATRALCESRDPELLPDLLALARDAGEANLRALAVRGYVRLATDEENSKFTVSQRAGLLKQVLAVANRVEDKRLILARLAGVPDVEALKLAVPLLDDAALQGEAAQAITQIAAALAGAQPETASDALKKVAAVVADPARKQAAQAVLKQIEGMADFITAWQVAGPYQQNGKNYAELFDVVFPPEGADAKGVVWKLLPAGTDASRPWLLDLLKAFGGEQRAAYVRTAVYSEKEQAARLELGSDDGVKVWLNGKVVYANNIARPIVAGSDKANVTLKAGWNTLMLKITQNNQGWEFCAKFTRPDGARLEGLKFDVSKAQ